MLRELDRVEKAALKVEQAREHLVVAMLAARDAGATLEAIGARAGLSAQRVHQILGPKKKRPST